MFLSEWCEFPSAPFLAEKKLDSSRLDVVEIARVTWHSFFQPPWQEKTCNSAHEETPLSNGTIDFVLRYRVVVRAKNLSVPLRKATKDTQTHTHAQILSNKLYFPDYIEPRIDQLSVSLT